MHFVRFSLSPNLTLVAATRETLGEKNLTWKTMQNAFSHILCTSRHVNHAKYTA